MSDWFYSTIRAFGYPAFRCSGNPIAIGEQHANRDGPFLLACTHQSPYDIPLLMRHVRKRRLDFVSVVEVFRQPIVGWLYRSMNAFPLDRSRPDAPTVRVILDRLARGRVVAMFPEGRFRRGDDSVVVSRRIQPGIGRIARLANVPIVPCVITNSIAYSRFSSWLPLKRTRYKIIFGEAILPKGTADELEVTLIDAFVRLHATARDTLY